MNRKRIIVGIAVVGILLSGMLSFQVFAQNDLSVTKFNQSTSDEFVPGQVVVGLEKPDPNFHVSVVARGGQVINTIDQINAHVIKVPVNSEDVFISSISHNPNVKYAERDVIMRATFPDDPLFDIQWGMQRIGMESAWQIDKTLGSGVIVAVVDGEVYYDHPDLTGLRILTNLDWDFVDKNDDVMLTELCNGKPDWHSTFVSGVVGATKDNLEGVAGVGPVDLLLVRVLDCGSGPSSVVAEGILYATNNEADVINLSLGSGFASTAIFDAVNIAHGNGAIIVASAGNGGSARPHYPSGFANVISVSATDIGDNLASYSNFGDTIELSAPGGESGPCSASGTTYIVSTAPILDENDEVTFGYVCAAGTSFSAPHVSGAAALLRDQYSQKDSNGDYIVTNEDIRSHLQTTAKDLGKPGWDKKFGYGLVRADSAVSTSIGAPPDPVNNAPTVSITSPADGSTFDSGTTINFAGSASDTEDGDLTASLVWTSDKDGQIGTGGSFSTTLSDGTHTITAQVTDSGGATASSSISITVGNPPAEATTVSVSSVTYATEGGKNKDKHLLITVALLDDLRNPVSGASVSIELYRDGSLYGSATGPTGADGKVTFSAKNAPSGCYTTKVTGVTADGLTWDGATPANQFCK